MLEDHRRTEEEGVMVLRPPLSLANPLLNFSVGPCSITKIVVRKSDIRQIFTIFPVVDKHNLSYIHRVLDTGRYPNVRNST